jgi:TolB-like protein/Tfp pilus assembly protein PilF
MRSATESSERDANGHGLPPDVSADSVRVELEKILASPGFANADRLSRFLRYAVEEHLNGQTDKLKESLLGIDVFGRKPSYDPRIDAVVRTEAVKLRARLKEYYDSDGREDAVIIDLPKGGYVPVFRLREQVSKEQAEPLPSPVAPFATLEHAQEPGRIWLKSTIAALFVSLVFAITIYVTMRDRSRIAAANAPQTSSIAVLPFEDLSPDRHQEYFCDGMTEEIIDSLTKIGGFRVVARTSSFAFKGKQQDIREIGKKLNVGYVLEGSVRKDGDRLRVTAQLNSVTDGYHMWSETYERELKDVFTVQDEISKSIVNTLQLRLAASPRSARPVAENLETYDLYLQGLYHWGRWRTEGAEKAIQYFEQAIAKDPKYAAAYAGLADSYTWLGFFGALPPNEAMPKAKQFAQKALELDGSSAEAHTSLGHVKSLYEFDWPGAEHEFKRAIQLNPNSSGAHFGYGITYLCPLGSSKACLVETKLCRDLDPLSPVANTYLGLALLFDQQVPAAVEQYKKALSLGPNFAEAHLSLANVYMDTRKYAQFYSEINKARGGAPEWRIDLSIAVAEAVQGKRNEALNLVHKWEHPPANVWVRPTSIASVYACLRDKENTFVWLEKAYTERDGILAFLREQHVFDTYRSDPRFASLVHQVGLQQWW